MLSHHAVLSMSDIRPGDHLISKSSQHYLVETIDTESSAFTAFTTQQGGRVTREHKNLSANELLRIDYDQQSNSYHPGKAIEMATQEMGKKTTKWDSSDCFVSSVKCGRKHVITNACLLSGDLEPSGCTCVTPRVAVDVGDHLVVRGAFGDYRSLLVYNCINEHTIVSMPNLNKKGTVGRLNLNDYNEVYRVNYPQSLPVEEILRRCCSPEAEQMLMEGGGDSSCFVTWAKIGKQLPVNVSKLLSRQQIAHIRPLEYEKILSVDEIEVGDHLFVPNYAYRWHFLVTEKSRSGPENELTFSTVYLLRGSVKENREKIDPTNDDVFKVLYPEEYPPSLSIQRARSLIGKVNLSPTARMWFVRWAKTSSEEGLEIDFLKRKSLPVSKSRIVCFSQLNPGDYLVQDKGKFYVRRHYLVTSVESATICNVIGAWKGRVQETQLSLDDSMFHRIIYEEGVCISTSESLQRAKEAIQSQFTPKLFRRKFVNYVKTTDAVEIDIEHLPEERLLLRREKVESGLDLKAGDHIELPVKVFQKVSYQDMIVSVVLSEKKIMVLCANPQDKVVEMEFEVNREAELYRVKYPERMSAEEGIKVLQRNMASPITSVS